MNVVDDLFYFYVINPFAQFNIWEYNHRPFTRIDVRNLYILCINTQKL